MIRHLLWPKWRIVRNAPKSAEIGRGNAVAFVLFGLVVWLGVLAGAYWFLGECLEVEPIGELLVTKILDLVLLVIFSILVFSNIITSFSTFYLAEDLQLLMCRPIPPNSFYTSRLLETAFLSGWMPLLFGMPVFIAAGVHFGAGPSYYLSVLLVLVPMVLIASAAAVPLTLALTNALPAHRTRDVFMLMGVLIVVILFILFRAINPEELFNPDRFANTMELFASLQSPNAAWLPSTWAWNALAPSLRGDGENFLMNLAGLVTTASALFFIGAWTFRKWHFSGYTKAQEGRHAGSGLERAAGWLGGKKLSGPEAAKRAVAKLESKAGALNPLLEMIVKDGKVFIRDTAQWSQLILLGALVVIYLLNFRYFRTMGDGGIIGPVGLYALNIALCGFVVSAVGVRFLFPAVSLEGRSFWMIKSAPMTMWSFLKSKWVAGLIPLLFLSELITILSNWMIGTPWQLSLMGVLVMFIINIGISGLGIGLGAIYPKFHVDNAAKIASGFGGILYMLSSMLLLVVIIVLSIVPAWTLWQVMINGTETLSQSRVLWASASLLGLLVIPPGVGVFFARAGARSLEKR